LNIVHDYGDAEVEVDEVVETGNDDCLKMILLISF
jgi:hypothetical protein